MNSRAKRNACTRVDYGVIFECHGRAAGLWDVCDYFEEHSSAHGCKWYAGGGYRISADECKNKAAQEAAITKIFRPKEGGRGKNVL